MLFSSPEFILFFLPFTLIGFFAIGRWKSQSLSIAWLLACSLFFYGWWNPAYLALIGFSVLFNFSVGEALRRREELERSARGLLVFGVTVNLGLLAYYKYFEFFVESVNGAFELSLPVSRVLLPLAISFFTFQQIGFLIDTYRGRLRHEGLQRYALFVCFFPQLIAGPIVHYRDFVPQLRRPEMYHLHWRNLALGLTIFSIGLFKKTVLADGLGDYVDPVFSTSIVALNVVDAWSGVLAYTFQIYFDFSGYSDMALGLGQMIGISLPVNFNSPYKSTSIIEFWRRWHMTLSHFLRDYVYIPLGGNQRGTPRRLINIIVTMGLGGLWHGAGWGFVLWGLLHGTYLVINHFWRLALRPAETPTRFGRIAGTSATFFAVLLGWVLFRAVDLEGAIFVYRAMLGMSVYSQLGEAPTLAFLSQVSLCFAVLALPCAGEIGGRIPTRAGLSRFFEWKPSPMWIAITCGLLCSSLYTIATRSHVEAFIYFNF